MTKPSVLIVDDHAGVRAGLVRLLEVAGYRVVGTACSGAEAVDAQQDTHPDVTIVDLAMPAVDGAETVRRIRAREPAAGVLVLTAHADRGRVDECLQAGAAGCVLKDADPDELLAAIAAIAAIAGRH